MATAAFAAVSQAAVSSGSAVEVAVTLVGGGLDLFCGQVTGSAAELSEGGLDHGLRLDADAGEDGRRERRIGLDQGELDGRSHRSPSTDSRNGARQTDGLNVQFALLASS